MDRWIILQNDQADGCLFDRVSKKKMLYWPPCGNAAFPLNITLVSCARNIFISTDLEMVVS